MKLFMFLLVLFGSSPLGLGAQGGSVSNVDFKGHFIGEEASDFLRIEPEAQQEADVCKQRPSRRSCDQLNNALKTGGRAELSTSDSMNFVLDGGKLVKLALLVDKPMDEARSDLAQKFGPETKASVLPSQNGAGAKWENRTYIWDLPSVYITLYQDNNPSLQDRRPLLTAESHAEHVLENVESPHQPTSVATSLDPKEH